MAKAKTKNKFYAIVLGGVVAVVILWFVVLSLSNKDASKNALLKPSPIPVATPYQQPQVFTAGDVMDNFSIKVPQGFRVEEMSTNVSLTNRDTEILITRSANNANTLKEVFDDDEALEDRKPVFLNINGLDAAYEINNERKTYYFYRNNIIFGITTTNPDYYSFLDGVAQSFQLPGS